MRQENVHVSQNEKCKKIMFCSVITNGVYKPLEKYTCLKQAPFWEKENMSGLGGHEPGNTML